jgi:integrase
MMLLAFRHGLRAGEVCDLRWEQVDFKTASLHVRRLKNGTPSIHPLTGRECQDALDQYRSARSSVLDAIKTYASCIKDSDGHDDCSS